MPFESPIDPGPAAVEGKGFGSRGLKAGLMGTYFGRARGTALAAAARSALGTEDRALKAVKAGFMRFWDTGRASVFVGDDFWGK